MPRAISKTRACARVGAMFVCPRWLRAQVTSAITSQKACPPAVIGAIGVLMPSKTPVPHVERTGPLCLRSANSKMRKRCSLKVGALRPSDCAERKSQRGVDGTARRGWLHRMSFSHSAYSTMNTNAAREILMPKRMPTSKGATSSHTANVALRKNKGKFATSMGPEVSLTRDSPLCCCTACSSATARTHGHGGRV
jgi:hypothetical protein